MSADKPPSTNSRFAPYKQALQAIATRTGAPLPSLVFSFAVLHEVTAIAPLFVIFFGARQLGLGERVVSAVTFVASEGDDNILKQKSRQWVSEGERWAERVGRRYGVFGYEKRKGEAASDSLSVDNSKAHTVSPALAGDVANAILAYGLTKALLPARIGLSLYLSPWFSRRVVEPVRGTVLQVFKRKSN